MVRPNVITMSNYSIENIDTNHYRIEQQDQMNTEVNLYISPKLLDAVEDESLDQLTNSASLPGVRYVGGMPDIHVGYGVPVGGVMGMDPDEGLISAGAVGMDINCGMRLMMSDIPAEELDRDQLKNLGRAILRRVPVGVGKAGPHQNELSDYTSDILEQGVSALVDPGFAREYDLDFIQDRGTYPGADTSAIPDQAWDRLGQLGTLGGGNHFIEIVEVDEVRDPEKAKTFAIENGNLGFMIHTGSRGFGHQICVDYSRRMKNEAQRHGLKFPDKELASAPINSELGQNYRKAMACAANVAYANRQVIVHNIRGAFQEIFKRESRDSGLRLVYDISHNLARSEEIDGKKLLVHRKGAIRALPAGHSDNPSPYQKTGHPVLIPGNMATGSYVLTAGNRADETWYSVNHGAGRTMSRTRAKNQINTHEMMNALGKTQLLGASRKKIRDEAPQAYKNIVDVIDVFTKINVTQKICHLRPLVTIKGD